METRFMSDSKKKLSDREQALLNGRVALRKMKNDWSGLHERGTVREGVIVLDLDDSEPASQPLNKRTK
jgi:hypothetical protein